jgi:hypothetical protein
VITSEPNVKFRKLLFYFLLNIKGRWTRYVARKGKIINEYKTLHVNLKGNDSLRNLSIEGSVIFKWTQRNRVNCGSD